MTPATERFRNEITGDVLELPPPNILGQGVVKLNGTIVERVLYSDESMMITLQNGSMLTAEEWSKYIVEC